MALFEDERKLRVTIMLTREQRDELQELAERAEVSRSQVARAALAEGIAAVRRIMDRHAEAWDWYHLAEGNAVTHPPGWAIEEAEGEIDDFDGRKTVGGEPTDEYVRWLFERYGRAMEIVEAGG